MQRLYVILFASLFIIPSFASAQCLGESNRSNRYSVQIDIDRAGISGVYIMQEQNDTVLCAIVNEFGVSALSFTYNPVKGRIKIVGCLPQLNKWYIKRILKRDLKSIIPQLQRWNENDPFEYYNPKFSIRYRFDKLVKSIE